MASSRMFPSWGPKASIPLGCDRRTAEGRATGNPMTRIQVTDCGGRLESRAIRPCDINKTVPLLFALCDPPPPPRFVAPKPQQPPLCVSRHPHHTLKTPKHPKHPAPPGTTAPIPAVIDTSKRIRLEDEGKSLTSVLEHSGRHDWTTRRAERGQARCQPPIALETRPITSWLESFECFECFECLEVPRGLPGSVGSSPALPAKASPALSPGADQAQVKSLASRLPLISFCYR